jgi:hypothetical protein
LKNGENLDIECLNKVVDNFCKKYSRQTDYVDINLKEEDEIILLV